MCGIAGFVGTGAFDRCGADGAAAVLRRMTATLRHRGPDEDGHRVFDSAALGMRRLSIIDLVGGTQPISNEDDAITVVFNGEIYNYREIRERLVGAGHTFRTCSDTETLVHLYEDLGSGMAEPLRGMFAFAIWDEPQHRLVLYRDRLGIKPLYYAALPDGLVFGSEIRALRAFPGVDARLDRSSIAEYLALGYIADPRTAYGAIQQIPPGHFLTWQDGRSDVKPFWTLPLDEDASIEENEAIAEIRRLLAESVRYRLVSDVPVGAFLSGGVDSSAVVSEMVRLTDRPVRTYSIGFEEDEFNEAPVAREVAHSLGTLHRELILREDADALTESVLDAFDEPFADSSSIPTFMVARLARTEVKVALSGDGGDELFGGYTRHLDQRRLPDGIPGAARLALGAIARRLPRGTLGRNRLIELARPARGRYAMAVTHPLRIDEGGVARPEVAALVDLDHVLDRWFDGVQRRDFLTQVSLVDLFSYLPGDILRKVDRMTMAVSLEARVPLLDHHLVEFAARLPARLKFRGGSGKWIFKQALRGRVPDLALDGPKKGFAVPLRPWLNGRLRHRVDALVADGAPVLEYADRHALGGLIREHRTGRRDNSAALWKLIVLNHWLAKQ